MAVTFELVEHLNEDLCEFVINRGKVSLALMNRERSEPFEYR